MGPDDKFYIQSINRAFSMLGAIAGEGRSGITLTELSLKTGLHTSTVYRILHNLISWQYVAQAGGGRYVLGMELVRLGSQAQRSIRLVDVAKKHIRELSLISGLTVYLSVFDKAKYDIVYMDKAESAGSIQLSANAGTRNHVHSTANGKVLMSGLPDGEIVRILENAGMPPLTEKTVTSADAYLSEVAEARRLGYAFDIEENEDNVVCVAAPIRDHSGHIAASISLSGIAGIIKEEDLPKNAALVVKTAHEISLHLGFRDAGGKSPLPAG